MNDIDKQTQLTELKATIEVARAAYLAIVDTGNRHEVQAASDAVKAAQRAFSDAICEGCGPCSDCASVDLIGLLQPAPPPAMPYFEIGCRACTDARPRHERPRGATPALCVAAWDADNK